MSRNASGVFSLVAGNPVNPLTTIATSWANPTLSDIASEITNSLDRNGRGGMTAPLKLADGNSSLPGLAFGSEPSTGWYRESAGVISLVAAAARRITSSATGVGINCLPEFALHVQGTSPLTVVDAAGGPSEISLRRANTSYGSPSAIVSADLIGVYAWRGHDGSAYTAAQASVAGFAMENWTGSARGTFITFNVTPVGSTTLTEVFRISSKGIGIGLIDPQYRVHVKNDSSANEYSTVVDSYEGATYKNSFGYGWRGADAGAILGNYSNNPLYLTTNNLIRFGIKADGRVFGRALHNHASGMPGATDQYIGSATYTPTGAAGTNVASVTHESAAYQRVGNSVVVSGSILIDPTAKNAQTTQDMSLPISCASTPLLAGCGVSNVLPVGDYPQDCCVVIPTSNTAARIVWYPAGDALPRRFYYTYQYIVN